LKRCAMSINWEASILRVLPDVAPKAEKLRTFPRRVCDVEQSVLDAALHGFTKDSSACLSRTTNVAPLIWMMSAVLKSESSRVTVSREVLIICAISS
jgi:hypothetical protein